MKTYILKRPKKVMSEHNKQRRVNITDRDIVSQGQGPLCFATVSLFFCAENGF